MGDEESEIGFFCSPLNILHSLTLEPIKILM
jgi:hypothetical protein